MKPEKFVRQVVGEYRKARKPVFKNKNIQRGRSHSVSSVLEDLFAYFLVKNSKDEIRVLIDQPVTVNGKVFYPDISIIKNNVLTNIFDLKTDIGWGRESLPESQSHHIETIERIRNATGSYKIGTIKEVRSIEVSKKITYDIVILNTCNSGKNLSKHIVSANKNSKYVNVFVLCGSEKYHTNQYNISKSELIKNLEINLGSFEAILNRVN